MPLWLQLLSLSKIAIPSPAVQMQLQPKDKYLSNITQMIVLIDSISDGVAKVARLARHHHWRFRRCAASAVVFGDDDILLHAAEEADPAEVSALLCDSVTPILVIASREWIAATDWSTRGYVAAVDLRRLGADLPGAVAEWRHAERLATIARLDATFGTAAVTRLLHGLRRALEAVLDAPNDARLVAEAHRIAGLAGTLGFAALGRHWLRVAEHRQAPDAATRRATAHALATLDRAEHREAFTIS